MRTTDSLAKAAAPHLKSVSSKVVKLPGTAAVKNKRQAAAASLRAEKAGRSLRSAGKLVEVKSKNKTAAKPQAKIAAAFAKGPSAKEAPKRGKANAVPATSARRASAAAPNKASKQKKAEKPASVKPTARIPESKKNASHKGLSTGLMQVVNVGRAVPQPNTGAVQARVGQNRPPRLSLDDIKIFQIYYQPEQQASLEPDFTPYDNSGNSSRLYEFSVFTKLAHSEQVKDAALWGAMSWKFGKKSGVSGRQLKEEIIAHPGYDAYYINPFPENEALFHNMWLQGEIAHPNFMPLCTEVFEVAGLPADWLNSVQPSSEFAAANYFVANQAFWKAYIGFVSRVLITADKKLSPTAKRILYSSTADKFSAHAEASYIPFLVERLFTVFLRTDGAKFKTFKLKFEEREKKGNVHLKLLNEMKDVACRTRSTWLAACWINYRNLYLSKTYGEGWTKHHLKQITPPNIVFMSASI